MASLIPGYEYDIFISYRQKDNKGDRWVSRFVDALKAELEATFKEDVSVYFDENPHDRLQETHNVNKSLEAKLKCLIFIPVLSQTYCDPSSYAWQYEFRAFNSAAKADRFGIDIRLKNGNFSARILPVRIHDLEHEDIAIFENETGSVLRSLDFVFRTASGVNRPLKPDEDHPNDNLAKTYFSDQINKVAHAIREIIQGIQAGPDASISNQVGEKNSLTGERAERKEERRKSPPKVSRQKWLIVSSAFLVFLFMVTLFVFPGLIKRGKLDNLKSSDGRISVVVLPFQNNTNDNTRNFWQNMIQDNIITYLSGCSSNEITVRQSESITGLLLSKRITDYSSLTTTAGSSISKELNAAIFIMGSINQSGSKVRLNAQLIDSRSEEVIKSFQREGFEDRIMFVIDSVSVQIGDFLILSSMKQKEGPRARKFESTSSPKAYEYFTSGNKAFANGSFDKAVESYTQALKCDSNYTMAMVWLSVAYLNLNKFKEGKECIMRAYQERDRMSEYMRSKVEDVHAWYTIGPRGRIKYLKQLIAFDDQDPANYFTLGNAYFLIRQFDDAIPELEKALVICEKYNTARLSLANYTRLGSAYHYTGQYAKEKKIYNKAELLFPGDQAIIRREAILAFSAGDTSAGNSLVEKYISSRRENQIPEPTISTNLAVLYAEAGVFDKAEKYYRQAVAQRPGDKLKMNDLALFLIDNERNIEEGLALSDIGLRSEPDNYTILHTKGWGLYKKAKYGEALDILQKSWDLRMQNAIYNHDAYVHLEEAKKAVASQKII